MSRLEKLCKKMQRVSRMETDQAGRNKEEVVANKKHSSGHSFFYAQSDIMRTGELKVYSVIRSIRRKIEQQFNAY